MEFKDLLGMTLTEVAVAAPHSDEITFKTACGRQFRMYHSQQCCEYVTVEDICGDIEDLIGNRILLAEEASNRERIDGYKPNHKTESWQWTFYKLATKRGYVTIRWLGTSNGYYSERVDFDEIFEVKKYEDLE